LANWAKLAHLSEVYPIVTEPAHAVFLSYASQDGEAAQRICTALRSAGIEVFLDQSELRGGDAWDQKIRREIHECALFMPVISVNTASRHEGYFRLEWDLADQRTHMMARNRVFIVPVCLDASPEAGADVPDSFQRVQWTRLPAGETPPAFVQRIKRLLSPELSPIAVPAAVPGLREQAPGGRRREPLLVAILAVIAVVTAALAYLLAGRHPTTSPGSTAFPATAEPVPAAFNPPPHSIAVLPFVNLSGDKEQEYFSDGLTEELLNSLADINELQVAARTSAFSFKGQDNDIGAIARKLNVGAVLEGSVRRSAHTIRITAQLINAVTGFHLWSKTYDRDLGDVLKLQTEIATAVASALKVTLLGDVATKVELGGTHNPAAFDAYLRGAKAYDSRHGATEVPTAIAAYTEAIRLDPNYALAFASRSIAFTDYAGEVATGAAVRENFDKAQADARQALSLAPDLAQAHVALGLLSENGTFDFTKASDAYERAQALAPGNAEVLRQTGFFAALMGHFDAGIAAGRRAVVLDPLARTSYSELGLALYLGRRYEEAIAAYAEVISLEPDFTATYGNRGFAYYGFGDLQSARASCETKRDDWFSQQCLAVVYDKLGRHADAEVELSKMKAALGDAASYQYATIYAQWGNRVQALTTLETALRLRDPGLEYLKTDPLLDPLRQEPRFKAIERELKFPD
jgi:TolB-like protein/Flp pilus assembly protein TadD